MHQSCDKKKRIEELVELLNRASESYYAKDEEIMSNYEYDNLYDELEALEKETGIVLSNSPTVNVGYQSVDELPKERHEKPMLSLAKTKEREELKSFLKDKEGLLSWKLDGLTIVLTYNDGELTKAVTRGNGEVGEVITNNAKVFKNIPLKIAFKGELILRGEAVITYSEFERINMTIADEELKYKNPRNLCSGTVRQLNNKVTAERNVRFYAFNLIKADGFDAENKKENEFTFLSQLGFEVVEFRRVNEKNILETVEYYANKIMDYDIPSDGLVLTYDDIAYGQSLGRTAKTPRDSIAFKWADETCETTLKEIEWSASRTGLINPVAIFEPVSLEGTTVSRASVHNVSIVKELKLGIGDRITVYKANMIIPQIAKNLTGSDTVVIPKVCPVCNQPTEIRQINDAKSLYCTNAECAAKKIKAFSLFVSRDAMNIDGMSEATLEKFLAKGFIKEYADLYKLDRYEDEITQMEGFGKKSYENIMNSIDTSRSTVLYRVVYGLGIAGVGLANAKLLCRYFNNDINAIMQANEEEISGVEGIGAVIANAVVSFMQEEKNISMIRALLEEITLTQEDSMEGEQTLSGMTVVITGSLNHFARREDLQAEIEKRGGKASGSVSKNTSVLVNNDIASASSKNKKAKELGVPIMTEEEFMEKYFG